MSRNGLRRFLTPSFRSFRSLLREHQEPDRRVRLSSSPEVEPRLILAMHADSWLWIQTEMGMPPSRMTNFSTWYCLLREIARASLRLVHGLELRRQRAVTGVSRVYVVVMRLHGSSGSQGGRRMSGNEINLPHGTK